MINEKLWAAIQKQFPSEIEKRLNDEDDGLEERKYNITRNILNGNL